MSAANPLMKTQTPTASSGTSRITRNRFAGVEGSLRGCRDFRRPDTTNSTVQKRKAEEIHRSPIDFAIPKPKGEAYKTGSKMFDLIKPAGKLTQIITYRMIQIEAGRTRRAAVSPRPFHRYNIAKQMTAPASRMTLRTRR